MDGRLAVDGVSKAVVALLGLLIIVDLLAIGSSVMQLELLDSFAAGNYDEAAANANDERQSTIGYGYLAIFIGTAITWMVWFSRAYRNVDVFGGVRSRETKWAVWGYIIPIISLYVPYQMMKEAFVASAPGPDDKTGLVGGWWALFIFSGIMGQVSLRMFNNADDIPSLVTATQVSIAESALDIPSAILAIVVVRQLTRWQMQRGPGNVQLAKVFD